ncbi:transposase [Streptomyces sp. NPDC050149]|uniref:transposase n=1 Tax=Streptomyces sp. NPDC050149 TaxID=3365603 RepID=UPI0037929C90
MSGWCRTSCGFVPAGGDTDGGDTSAGWGRRRADDREALAAIVFVATSGCTWRKLPPVFGPSRQQVHRRFTQGSRTRARRRRPDFTSRIKGSGDHSTGALPMRLRQPVGPSAYLSPAVRQRNRKRKART